MLEFLPPDILGVTLPYGTSFDSLFNQIGTMRNDIYTVLMNFTYALAFAGLLMAAYRQSVGGDLSQLGNQLLATAVIAVIIQPSIFPEWMLDVDEVLGFSLIESMNIDMEAIVMEYIDEVVEYIIQEVIIVVADLAAAALLGFFSIVAGIVACLFALVAIIFIVITGIMAFWVWACLLLAYLVQAMSVELGIAISPLFMGMFLFPTTKETGLRYFTGLFAIMFWPLGWGIGWKMVDLCTDAWQSVLNGNAVLWAMDKIFAGIIGGVTYYVVGMMFWTVIKKAPPLVNKAITTGSQIGAGLVSAGIASAASTVSSTMSAAGAGIQTAGQVGGMAAGAALGGAASGGAGASAGASMGGAIGGAAGSAAAAPFTAGASGVKSAGEGLGGMSEGA